MKKYVLIFSARYLVLVLAHSVARIYLNLQSSIVHNVIIVCLSSIIAAIVFKRDQNRSPTAEETKSFSLLSLLSVWAISLCVMVGLVAYQSNFSPVEVGSTLDTLASTGFLFTFILISALYYLAIRASFPWYIKKVLLP